MTEYIIGGEQIHRSDDENNMDLVKFQNYVNNEIEFRLTFDVIHPDYCKEVGILTKLDTLRLITAYLFTERKMIIMSDYNGSQQREIIINYSKMDLITCMMKNCHDELHDIILEKYETVYNNDIDARLIHLEKHFKSILPFDFTK